MRTAIPSVSRRKFLKSAALAGAGAPMMSTPGRRSSRRREGSTTIRHAATA